MGKILIIVWLAAANFLQVSAKPISDFDKVKSLEEKCSVLQNKQADTDNNLRKLSELQKATEKKMRSLAKENRLQASTIDSLQNVCNLLEKKQLADNESIKGKIDATDNDVRTNQDQLQTRTLWGTVVVTIVIVAIIGIALLLTKRIKRGTSAVDEVRRAQEALQVAHYKMQEEAIRLDDRLLELLDRQLSNTPKVVGNDGPSHALALKVADQVVRIEQNMARMDSSVKGYRQLARAVERIKDNFNANGYEIVDMLGMPYNEGMRVSANFVTDEDLEEGKQIITGITKPQVNYNGQMIQAAQITVSQNI